MPRSLVTGGAGFIGSHLVHALLARGDEVRVLDNFSSGKMSNLDGLQGPLQVLEADLRDPAAVAAAVRGVEQVFHHAAFVSVPGSMEDPGGCFEVNVQGTLTLLEAARQAGVRRVVLASSAAVYGDSDALPLAEDTPLRPLSPYALSKQINELQAALYTTSFGLEVVALRYFNIFGPRQAPDSQYAAAVPIFVRRRVNGQAVTIFGDGGQTRDLVYVSDVVRANLLAAVHPDAPGRVFNVCSGRELTMIELVGMIDHLLPGAPQPEMAAPRPGDIYRSVGSPRRSAEVLGFHTSVPLEQGLIETIDWMRP